MIEPDVVQSLLVQELRETAVNIRRLLSVVLRTERSPSNPSLGSCIRKDGGTSQRLALPPRVQEECQKCHRA